jgi:hypothetical protein
MRWCRSGCLSAYDDAPTGKPRERRCGRTIAIGSRVTVAPDPMTPHRAWWETRWCVALALLLSAVPLLWWPVPPLTDLPGHMGRYRVMLGTDPGLSQWYHFAWRPIGYLGVDLLVRALAPVIGLESAVKAIVVAIPVLAAAGMLWLSREVHGRVQPTAYFALPFAYHTAFLYGFLNYTLAMALALCAFALWLRMARRPGLRAGVFVVISALIWTAHLFGWLCLGVMIFSAEVARARAVETDGVRRGWIDSAARAVVNCLPLAPPALMLLAWRPGGASVGSDWLVGLHLKPGWLASALRDRWQLFDIGCMIVVALVIYRSYRDRHFVHAPMLAAAAIGLLALFVAMPFGSAYADMRIAPYVIVLALLSIRFTAWTKRRRRERMAWAACAFFVVRTAAGTASFGLESADWTRHLAALDHVPHGARVAAFVGSTCEQPWRMARTGHLPGMAIVRRGAFSNDQFDLGATALLTVTAPGITGFATDPSQIVLDRPCATSPEFRTLDQALTQLPRERFDMLWLITPGRIDPARLGDARLVWSDGRDALFALPHARAPR